jgi:hypothetical protein
LVVQSAAGRGPRLVVSLPYFGFFVHRDEFVWEYKPWTYSDDGDIAPCTYREMGGGWVRVQFDAVTPGMIEKLIRRARELGWQPEGSEVRPVRIVVPDPSESYIPASFGQVDASPAEAGPIRRQLRRRLTAVLFAIGRDRVWRERVYPAAGEAPVDIPPDILAAADPLAPGWADEAGVRIRAWNSDSDVEDQRWFRLEVGASSVPPISVGAMSDVPAILDYRPTSHCT